MPRRGVPAPFRGGTSVWPRWATFEIDRQRSSPPWTPLSASDWLWDRRQKALRTHASKSWTKGCTTPIIRPPQYDRKINASTVAHLTVRRRSSCDMKPKVLNKTKTISVFLGAVITFGLVESRAQNLLSNGSFEIPPHNTATLRFHGSNATVNVDLAMDAVTVERVTPRLTIEMSH